MMVTVTRRFEWDSAHRVMRHESKCATLHGHRYVAEVTVTAEELDEVDRVIDFGVLKERLGAWIDDRWDHTTLVNERDEELLVFCKREEVQGKRAPYVFPGEPTAETIAATLMRVAKEILPQHLMVRKVRVYETPNCYAEAS